nr:hypothetical protein [Tanacetum cinerariifolium]
MWIPLPQRVSFRCSDRPEIDTYRSQFKSLFPNKDVKEEFPDWFGSQIRQRHVDNDKDPEVSTTSELFALACGPTWTPISINSCVVDGVSLNDLDNATLRIDGQSMEVDVPPDIIIDVVEEYDDITDDEDMSTDVARSHDGDSGGEDRPLPTMYPAVAWVALLFEAKANESPIWATQFDLRPHLESPDWTEINRQTSTTQEYPSLIDTFFVAHTVNREFLRDEDRCIYEMRRLEAMGTYIDDEINCLARDGKQRGHIAGMGRFESGGASGSGGCEDEDEGADHQDDEDEDGDGDT